MIKLTENAALKVNSMLADAEDGKVLRIFIDPGGCSGFEYGMAVDLPKADDIKGEDRGVPFAVDRSSLEYLSGSEVHFDDGLSGKGFEIRNPNAQTTCGCGKSFS
ncbi:iron-sulfur cluster assembly accessory protein [Opitutales bacterium]|jgi:iron-sulfur cluster assembly accessory protein|nr:iron-sulfur cluster assembly accessory protein [Opitutales bacterium]